MSAVFQVKIEKLQLNIGLYRKTDIKFALNTRKLTKKVTRQVTTQAGKNITNSNSSYRCSISQLILINIKENSSEF